MPACLPACLPERHTPLHSFFLHVSCVCTADGYSLLVNRTKTGMYMLGQGVAKNEGMARHILKIVAKYVVGLTLCVMYSMGHN